MADLLKVYDSYYAKGKKFWIKYRSRKVKQQSVVRLAQDKKHSIHECGIDEYAPKKQYCDTNEVPHEAVQHVAKKQSCESKEQLPTTSITLTKITDLANELIISIIVYLPVLEAIKMPSVCQVFRYVLQTG